jgi:act minimal PKS acyl carrier protein
MSQFTIDDLRRILRQCAGEPELLDLDDDIHNVALTEMGYDSLALLEMAARIQQEFGVPLSDEEVGQLRTPQEVIRYVNAAAGAR